MHQRAPHPELRAYIKTLWARSRPTTTGSTREVTLPSKNASIVIRLDGSARNLVSSDESLRPLASAVISGIQTRSITKIGDCTGAVGVELRPGALMTLTGAHADEFTDDHVPLDAIFGTQKTQSLIDRLKAEQNLADRLHLFESFLLSLAPSVDPIHPVVSGALLELDQAIPISRLVAGSGMSHRHFNHLFRANIGISAKYFQRLLRIDLGVAKLTKEPSATWSDVALSSGYADQPHFNREFKVLTGLTPTLYTQSSRRGPLHVLA